LLKHDEINIVKDVFGILLFFIDFFILA